MTQSAKSLDKTLGDGDRAYEREWTRGKIAVAVWRAFDALRRDKGWTQDRLAQRLNKNKGQVSRLLNNPGNWTLDTVADLFAAMDVRMVDVDVRRVGDIVPATNQGHNWIPIPNTKTSGLVFHPSTGGVSPTISSQSNNANIVIKNYELNLA